MSATPPPPHLPTKIFYGISPLELSFGSDSDSLRSSPEKAEELSSSSEKPLRHIHPLGGNAIHWIFEKHRSIGYAPGQVVTWINSKSETWKRFYSIQRTNLFHIFCTYSEKAHKKENTLLEGTFKTARDVCIHIFDSNNQPYDRQLLLLIKPKNRSHVLLNPLDKVCFEQEIKFMSAFRKVPGILQLLDTFTYSSGKGRTKTCLIVEKYSTNLAKAMDEKTLTPKIIRHIQCKLLEALVKIHEKGFIHRDIKPDNILLNSEENSSPVFADFGLSVGPDEESHFSGGTPRYLAPEAAYAMYLKECLDQHDPRFSPQKVLDTFKVTTTCAMDVFSLGMVFLEMTNALKFPFGETIRERASLYPRSGLNPDVELGLHINDYQLPSSWIGKMVARDPRTRFSAKEALSAMKESHRKEIAAGL